MASAYVVNHMQIYGYSVLGVFILYGVPESPDLRVCRQFSVIVSGLVSLYLCVSSNSWGIRGDSPQLRSFSHEFFAVAGVAAVFFQGVWSH